MSALRSVATHRKNLRDQLFYRFDNFAQARGFILRRRSVYSDPALVQQLLLRTIETELVIDIGANEGQYASGLLGAGFEGEIFSVEPLPGAHQRLQENCRASDRWSCSDSPLAVGPEAGMLAFHETENGVSSSLLAPLDSHRREEPDSATVGVRQVPAITLDELLTSQHADPSGRRMHLKLDVQGAEMAILESSLNWGDCASLQLELSLAELYEGQSGALELLTWLDTRGYALVGVEQGFMSLHTGQTLQFDGFFVRRPIPSAFT